MIYVWEGREGKGRVVRVDGSRFKERGLWKAEVVEIMLKVIIIPLTNGLVNSVKLYKEKNVCFFSSSSKGDLFRLMVSPHRVRESFDIFLC